MISLLVLIGAALAGGPRVLDLKVSSPEAVVLDQTVSLPASPVEASGTLGGVPIRVVVTTQSQHDTVVVDVQVIELRGKKQKPVEVARPKLTLYEEYPGRVEFKAPAPKDYGTPEVTWVVEASWVEQKPAAPADPPDPDAAPADPPDPDAAPVPAGG